MKLYLPMYNNGESWEDNYESHSSVCFTTREDAKKWINSKYYTEEDKNGYFRPDPKRKIIYDDYDKDYDDYEPLYLSKAGYFDEDDYSFYTIDEIELIEALDFSDRSKDLIINQKWTNDIRTIYVTKDFRVAPKCDVLIFYKQEDAPNFGRGQKLDGEELKSTNYYEIRLYGCEYDMQIDMGQLW